MRRLACAVFAVTLAMPLRAQSSLSACGPLPDSTSRQIIKVYGGLRACLIATKVVGTDAELPHEWAARGAQVIMETQRTDDNRRASIAGDKVAWTINGQPAPIDSMADRWQKSVLDLLDASYEADGVRQQAADLREQIDSLPAKRALVAARMKYIQDRDAAIRQQLMEVQRRDRDLQSTVSTTERQRIDIERRLSTERSRAAGARDEQTRRTAEANVRSLELSLQQLEDRLRSLERQRANLDASRVTAAGEEELRALRPEHTLTMLRLQLASYDSTNTADIQRQLTQLDAQQRLPALDARVETARLALIAVLEARGKAPSR